MTNEERAEILFLSIRGRARVDEAVKLILAYADDLILDQDLETIRQGVINDFRMDELDAVMMSVDKWLPADYPTGIDPANRAADAREIALKAIEANNPDEIRRECAEKIDGLNNIIDGCIAAFKVAAMMPGTADVVAEERDVIMGRD